MRGVRGAAFISMRIQQDKILRADGQIVLDI
jgi:hypothetical protein